MRTQLKWGSTNDKRLDRIVEFDERSRGYSISALATPKKLRSYTWRCRQTLDQGTDGACVGFGVSHELIARPSEVQNLGYGYAKELYFEAQRIDPWPGGEYPGADPVYGGTSVLSGIKVAHKLGWFDEYRWAFSMEDFYYGLGHNGPSVIGINWYEGMLEPDSNNFIRPTGSLTGGHCLLVNAISMKNQRVTVHNSWGTDWGKNGEAYLSFNDISKLLHETGEAVFFIKRHKLAVT